LNYIALFVFLFDQPGSLVSNCCHWGTLEIFGVGFLPWNAVHSADCAIARSPSIRLSVTCQYSVKKGMHILELFLPSGSHTILVFPFKTVWQYSDVDPLLNGTIFYDLEWPLIQISRLRYLQRQITPYKRYKKGYT